MAFGTKNTKKSNCPPSMSVVDDRAVRNAAMTLLANIRFMSVDAPIKTIAVTSSVPNEGKTTTAVALACAIGESGETCLLVENDLRRQSLRSMLRAKPRYGLHALLTGEHDADDVIVGTDLKGVSFLDAERGVPNPEELLMSKSYEALLQELAAKYDYVLIDTPPVGAYADGPIVASKVDGTALVLREGYCTKAEASYSVEQLQAANAHILGVVFNSTSAANSASCGYYYDYYYREETVAKDSPEAQAALGGKEA